MNASRDAPRAPRADVGAARHRAASSRATSSATINEALAGGEPRPGRVRAGPRRRGRDPPTRRRAVGRRGCEPARASTVPDAPHVHVFVAAGRSSSSGSGTLGDGRRRPTGRRRCAPGHGRRRGRRGPRLGDLVSGYLFLLSVCGLRCPTERLHFRPDHVKRGREWPDPAQACTRTPGFSPRRPSTATGRWSPSWRSSRPSTGTTTRHRHPRPRTRRDPRPQP